MSPLNLQLFEAWMNSKTIYPAQRNALRSITGIFGIFNLDFCVTYIPNFVSAQTSQSFRLQLWISSLSLPLFSHISNLFLNLAL